MKSVKVKSYTKLKSKKITKPPNLTEKKLQMLKADIEDAEEINNTFCLSDRPESMSEMKEASSQAKQFYKYLDKYFYDKKMFSKLPQNLQKKISELESNNEVYDPEDDF